MINNDNIAHKVSFPRSAEGGRTTVAANFLSTVFSPALVVFYTVILRSYSIEHSLKFLWTSFFLLVFVLVPTAYVFYLMGQGKVTDFHMSVREERIRPLCIVFVYCALSLLLYWVLGGPGALVTLGSLCLALTGLWILVSLWWKISGHCAAMGALAAVVFAHPHETLIFILPPLALMVTWARIRLGSHSLAQTMAGFVLGAAVFWFFLP
ncbi:MAG: hypothetical protein OXF23_04315 [Candidatus Dadabacteria bacterium]|nr:hypothetical protein [Candidatus Dadabacteria bacterium]MCY4262544.1 hypothetical protein [Candidatus Dadabacteria bacterium]